MLLAGFLVVVAAWAGTIAWWAGLRDHWVVDVGAYCVPLAVFAGGWFVVAAGPRWVRALGAALGLTAWVGAAGVVLAEYGPPPPRFAEPVRSVPGDEWDLVGLGYPEIPAVRAVVFDDAWPDPNARVRLIVIGADGELSVDRRRTTLAALPDAVRDGPPGDLRLVVDRWAPWRSVQWVFQALEAAGVRELAFAARPADRGSGASPIGRLAVPLSTVSSGASVPLHVLPRDYKRARYGDTRIERATRARFRLDGRDTEDADEIAARLRTGRDGPFRLRVLPGAKVPAGFVLEAVSAAVAAGATSFETHRVAPPDAEEAHAERLPYPRRNFPADLPK